MTDHPILFSAPMVRALLDGSKTQTRRVARSVTTAGLTSDEMESLELKGWDISNGAGNCIGDHMFKVAIRPGDRLWVRENFQAHSWAADCATIRYAAEAKTKGFTAQIEQIPYPAGDRNAFKYIAPKGPDIWRPSIHMPRWASRLTLIVTDVRVQRLQEIKGMDPIEEGIEQLPRPNWHHNRRWRDYSGQVDYLDDHRDSFRTLWNATYGPDAWDQNPWVVATTFTTHHCNIDKMGEA